MSILGFFSWWRRLLGGRWRRGDEVEDHGYTAPGTMSEAWRRALKKRQLDSAVENEVEQ